VSAAYERAARRLAALPPAERHWVLGRLAPEDALAIRELMSPRPPAAQAEAPREAAPGPSASAASLLERASVADVAAALQEEPDWLLALVLARRRWPWDRGLLAGLNPLRLATLARLTRTAGEAAKPKACEAAIEGLAARLIERSPKPAPASAFEEVLAAAQRTEG
jgi:hypothetical protein